MNAAIVAFLLLPLSNVGPACTAIQWPPSFQSLAQYGGLLVEFQSSGVNVDYRAELTFTTSDPSRVAVTFWDERGGSSKEPIRYTVRLEKGDLKGLDRLIWSTRESGAMTCSTVDHITITPLRSHSSYSIFDGSCKADQYPDVVTFQNLLRRPPLEGHTKKIPIW